MLTEIEKSHLRHLVESPQWQSLERAAEEFIKQIQDNSPIRDTTDETLKQLYLQEGKVQGIRDFLQKMINLLQEK